MREEKAYIYGKHPVTEALVARPEVVVQTYLAPGSGLDELRTLAHRAGVGVVTLNSDQLPKGVDRNAVHQGAVAEVALEKVMVPLRDFLTKLDPTPDTGLVVLGELQDPHNVGAIIRSAAAFGMAGVLLPEHRQAPLTPAAVKASAGMVFRVPIVSIGNVSTCIRSLKEKGFWVYGLAGEGSQSLRAEDFSKPSVFVAGNEGSGLREKTKEECDIVLSIPQHPRCESLNASVSTAVVFYEWSKQHPQALINQAN